MTSVADSRRVRACRAADDRAHAPRVPLSLAGIGIGSSFAAMAVLIVAFLTALPSGVRA